MRLLFSFALACFALSAQGVVISAPVFAGAGLNDATSGGRYTPAPANAYYVVTITTAAGTDKFKWAKNGGAQSAAISITGAAQSLTDGVTITFAATTGHTLTNYWTITVTASGSLAGSNVIQRGLGALFRGAQDKARETVSSSDYQTLQLACDSTTTGAGVLHVYGSITLAADTTCSAAVWLEANALIATAGHALTLSGYVDGTRTKHFDVSGGGSVVAGSAKATAHVDALWWEVADGTTDDTTAIQAAFNYFGSAGAANPRSGRLLIAGPFILSGTIAIKNFAGQVDCQGSGDPAGASPLGNYIKWKTGASSGIPMFKYDNSRSFSVTGCHLIGNSANPPLAAWNCQSGAYGGGAASQSIRFSDFRVEGGAGGGFTNGFLTNGDNANCDSHYLENGFINNTGTAINLTRTQNVAWVADNVICVNNTVACGAVAGSLLVINGSLGQNGTDWLFQKDSSGSSSDPIIQVIGAVSDGSGRWVDDGGVAFGAGVFLSSGGAYNVTDAGGAINDGACGPTSNTSLYANCTFFVRFNTVTNIQAEILGTQINTSLATLKPIFNFGSPVGGGPRHLLVRDINASCPSWDATNFLIMTAITGTSVQDYEFPTSCDGGWRSISGPAGANAVIQPTAGQFNYPSLAAQSLTLPGGGGGWTSFSPALQFGGGSTGITYSVQNGEWILIGGIYYVRVSIIVTNKGSSAGTAAISGLPSSHDFGTNSHWAAAVAYANGLTGTNVVSAGVSEGAGRVDLYDNAGGATNALTNASFAAGAITANIQLSVWYPQ